MSRSCPMSGEFRPARVRRRLRGSVPAWTNSRRKPAGLAQDHPRSRGKLVAEDHRSSGDIGRRRVPRLAQGADGEAGELLLSRILPRLSGDSGRSGHVLGTGGDAASSDRGRAAAPVAGPRRTGRFVAAGSRRPDGAYCRACLLRRPARTVRRIPASGRFSVLCSNDEQSGDVYAHTRPLVARLERGAPSARRTVRHLG